MIKKISLAIGTVIAICITVLYSTRNTGIFFPRRIEVGTCVVRNINKVLYSSRHYHDYVVDFTYIDKTTRKGEKLGNCYETNYKKDTNGFKRGDTLQIYRKPFSNEKFVIDRDGKERYFCEEYILIN